MHFAYKLECVLFFCGFHAISVVTSNDSFQLKMTANQLSSSLAWS